MTKEKKEKEHGPVNFPDKWWKVIQAMPEFKETADAASEDDLKKVIVTCEGHLYTINQDEESDTQLAAYKDLVKERMAPHKEGRKFQQAKIQYALFLLEGKGVDLDSKKDED